MDPVLPAENNNMVKLTLPSKSSTGPSFHLFTELLGGLQREIWRLVVPPRAIRLEFENPGYKALIGYRDAIQVGPMLSSIPIRLGSMSCIMSNLCRFCCSRRGWHSKTKTFLNGQLFGREQPSCSSLDIQIMVSRL